MNLKWTEWQSNLFWSYSCPCSWNLGKKTCSAWLITVSRSNTYQNRIVIILVFLYFPFSRSSADLYLSASQPASPSTLSITSAETRCRWCSTRLRCAATETLLKPHRHMAWEVEDEESRQGSMRDINRWCSKKSVNQHLTATGIIIRLN